MASVTVILLLPACKLYRHFGWQYAALIIYSTLRALNYNTRMKSVCFDFYPLEAFVHEVYFIANEGKCLFECLNQYKGLVPGIFS